MFNKYLRGEAGGDCRRSFFGRVSVILCLSAELPRIMTVSAIIKMPRWLLFHGNLRNTKSHNHSFQTNVVINNTWSCNHWVKLHEVLGKEKASYT